MWQNIPIIHVNQAVIVIKLIIIKFKIHDVYVSPRSLCSDPAIILLNGE